MNRPRPIAVKPMANYRLWLRYSDGIEGTVDLSDLVGRGVFGSWQLAGEFERLTIGSGGELVWPNGADLCPDATYMRLTGNSAAGLTILGP